MISIRPFVGRVAQGIYAPTIETASDIKRGKFRGAASETIAMVLILMPATRGIVDDALLVASIA